MGVLAGGGVGVEAAARGGRRRAEVGGDRADAAPGGVHWGLILILLRRHCCPLLSSPLLSLALRGGKVGRRTARGAGRFVWTGVPPRESYRIVSSQLPRVERTERPRPWGTRRGRVFNLITGFGHQDKRRADSPFRSFFWMEAFGEHGHGD